MVEMTKLGRPRRPRRIELQTRLPPGLHRKLKSDASARGQSLNSTVIQRLERSFLMDDVKAWLDSQTGER